MRARTLCDETGLLLHDDGIFTARERHVHATARHQSYHGAGHHVPDNVWFLRCSFSGYTERVR